MTRSLNLNPQPSTLCELCGKPRGSHQAHSYHCPVGLRGRANTYSFSTKAKFQARPPRICATIDKALKSFGEALANRTEAYATGCTREATEQANAEYLEARMVLYQKIARLEAKLAIATETK
jgi:hypothetical protein